MAVKYDFGGIATAYNIRCADGKTIRTGAFKDCDGVKVPLMWNHQHGSVDNVLGHAVLKDRGNDVYAYCKFNDTSSGRKARKMLENGDIDALSIYANDLTKNGSVVKHGTIREVSMVVAGANPGATIDVRSIAHSMGIDPSDPEYEDLIEDIDEAEIYHGMEDAIDIFDEDEDDDLAHAGTDDGKEEEKKPMAKKSEAPDDKTVEDVVKTMNEEQQNVFYGVIGAIVQKYAGEESGEDEEEEKEMAVKHNLFDTDEQYVMQPVLDASERKQMLEEAKRYGSLRDYLKHSLEDPDSILMHAYPYNHDDQGNPTTQQTYGIADINWLFPEARNLTNTPEWIKRDMDWVSKLMNSTKHTPFARVKSMFADITEDEARAKGYIKGDEKKEEVFTLLRRTTDPQTIYKLQQLDRDDIIDITDFDIVAWIRGEMRMMLNEEIARAILVGDGRSTSSREHISESHVRSIYHDDDFFSVKVAVNIPNPATDDQKAKALIRAIKKNRKLYKGSGDPIFFTTEDELANMLLLEDGQGYFMFKTVAELATVLRVREIVTVPVMEGLSRTFTPAGSQTEVTAPLAGILVNPADYNIGADRGGEINNFDDFDIKFNQYQYLIETRISGALVKPKSALVMEYVQAAG